MVTDLAPEQAEGLWYGMRAWIEHGYKLLKAAGWHWDQTRMTDCDRAERLWLVLAVATRYVLAVGGDFEASQEVPVETIPELAPAGATGGTAGTKPSGEPRAARGAAQSGVASPSRGALGSAPRGRRSGWSACSAKGSRRWSLL